MNLHLKSSSPPSGVAGFTLIEVLLAFLVFAISFAVVLQILSASTRNTVRAREYTEVALMAQSLMDQVGLDIPLQPGFRTGGENDGYRWEMTINPFTGGADNADILDLAELTGVELLEVELVISWGTYPREHSNRFSTVKGLLKEFLEQNA